MKLTKNILSISLLSAVALLHTSVFAQDINVYINEQKLTMEVAPEINRSTTFVPISIIAKELDAEVIWEKPHVIIKKDDNEIICTIGSLEVEKNGIKTYLSAPAYISHNRTFIPLRFVSEQLGNKVFFDESDKSIHISPYAPGEEAPNLSDIPHGMNNDYKVSHDGLWGIKKEQMYSPSDREDIIFLKNNTTGEIKEIYTSSTCPYYYWLKNNTLLLSGLQDPLGGPERPHLMIYDPNTGKFTNLVDADGFSYLESLDSIIYYIDSPNADPEFLIGYTCKMFNLITGETTDITCEEYSSYSSGEFDN